MRTAFSAIGGLACVVALGWVLTGNGLAMQRYFAPKQEAVRRQTFEQSKAYREGMAQEIQNMQFEYEQADSAHQAALRSVILHRVADMDVDALPASTQAFVSELRRAR